MHQLQELSGWKILVATGCLSANAIASRSRPTPKCLSKSSKNSASRIGRSAIWRFSVSHISRCRDNSVAGNTCHWTFIPFRGFLAVAHITLHLLSVYIGRASLVLPDADPRDTGSETV